MIDQCSYFLNKICKLYGVQQFGFSHSDAELSLLVDLVPTENFRINLTRLVLIPKVSSPFFFVSNHLSFQYICTLSIPTDLWSPVESGEEVYIVYKVL